MFTDQFNIALNRKAAKEVFNGYKEFFDFTVVPSHTAQNVKYPALALKRVGGDCLTKRILLYNLGTEPMKIAMDVAKMSEQLADKALPMPDLTATALTATESKLKKLFPGMQKKYVEVIDEGPGGALLFKPSSTGIPILDIKEGITLTESQVIGIFAPEHLGVSSNGI